MSRDICVTHVPRQDTCSLHALAGQNASGGESDHGETGGLAEARHQVEALNGLAGGALHEIVDGAEHDDGAGPIVVARR